MKLISKLQQISIPEKMLIDGKIEIDSVKFITIQSTQDVTTGFKIELNITVSTDINGFKVEPFKSKISHTLSQQQFNQFMDYLHGSVSLNGT